MTASGSLEICKFEGEYAFGISFFGKHPIASQVLGINLKKQKNIENRRIL
jgi:hypothetical protein